ncbi:MAG: YcnI family copper-binding membrane protein [Jatrophihabitans sp.]
MSKLRRGVAVLTLSGAVGLSGLLSAGAASAHVTVAAPGASVGASDAAITFRVPDESDAASTVGLKVQLPTDHPIAGVLVAPLPGWTSTITTTKLSTPIKTDDGDITEVVSEIDWTAQAGQGIKSGYFGQFSIIGGALPDDVSSLTFKAIQTYSDKSVVSWIDVAAPGSTVEPDHPAPTLTLAAAKPAGSAPVTASTTAPAVATASGGDGKATTAVVLGVLGILLGGAALALVLLRGRRSGLASSGV